MKKKTPQKRNKFTFVDLFAGLGGIRIGLEKAGGRCVFSSEWDVSAQDMYEKYFGERPAGDITKIEAKDIPDHDILAGGFPCQAFSIIGDMKGFSDTRGTLFFDVERIIREKKPSAILLENVKQLTRHDGGRTFKVILARLKKLGYFVHTRVLNGLDFGVPQKRERIIIVGFRKNHPFKFPVPLRERKKLESVLEKDNSVDKKYFLSSSYREKLNQRLVSQGKKIPKTPVILHENKSGNIGINNYSCALRANGSYNYLVVNGKRRLTPREMLRLQGFPDSYEIVVSDFQARKQAGNSVVVPLMEAVAKEIAAALQKPPVPIVPV